MKREYVISPVTIWNDDNFTWETKVGEKNKNLPLSYITCGKTEAESRGKAEELVQILITQN